MAYARAGPPYCRKGGPHGENCMDLTEISVEGYEKVIQCHDAHSGLNAIISIHNTAHGPALGGMRMWPYVVGLSRAQGGSGDPAPYTALGVFLGLRTCVEWALHTDDLRGMRVAVQGCGNVASPLCQRLRRAGALLTVTDVVPAKAQRLAQQYGACVVGPEEIYDVPCEVYAPCALGGTLNDHTISRLQCHIVAGSANNQCLRAEHGDALRQRGIVYAPDFVINAGGLLNVVMEFAPGGYHEARVLEKVRHIAEDR